MVDPSAWLIRRFEQFGWATKVRWPAGPEVLEGRAAVSR
jgi:hypothetical protein